MPENTICIDRITSTENIIIKILPETTRLKTNSQIRMRFSNFDRK